MKMGTGVAFAFARGPAPGLHEGDDMAEQRGSDLTSKARDIALTAGGMAALLAGRKLFALGAFGRGIRGLERGWRAAHPEFSGGLDERWQAAVRFYESTHRHPTNRWLHIVGIPLIAGGAGGLLVFPAYRPLWALSAGSFALGWALNIVGHVAFEKNRPAFADDPLSFVAGPVWDARRIRAIRPPRATAREART